MVYTVFVVHLLRVFLRCGMLNILRTAEYPLQCAFVGALVLASRVAINVTAVCVCDNYIHLHLLLVSACSL